MTEKIINLVKKYKIFIFLALFILVLFFVRFFLKKPVSTPKKQPSPSLEQERPMTSPVQESPLLKISPSPILFSPSPIPQTLPDKLNLVSVYPASGINETLFDQYKIYFTFDKNLKLDTLEFTISPKISLTSSANKNSLSFYPQTPFLFNTDYLLTISRLTSLDDQPLAAPIKYQFRLNQPANVYVW